MQSIPCTLNKITIKSRIFRTFGRYSNNPDIQGIIRNFGETERDWRERRRRRRGATDWKLNTSDRDVQLLRIPDQSDFMHAGQEFHDCILDSSWTAINPVFS